MDEYIKCRAKSVNGDWVYKYLSKDYNDPGFDEEILLSSFCRFSGYKDIDDNEIYEYDVITVNGYTPLLVKYIPVKKGFCLARVEDLDLCKDKDIWQLPNPDFWSKNNIKIISHLLPVQNI